MATRTLGVALWDYRDHDGRKRRAHYRETFDLPDSEVERGQHAGVFDAVAWSDLKSDPSEGVHTVDIRLPERGATNGSLVDWLVEHRDADRDEIKRLNKQALWQLVNAI